MNCSQPDAFCDGDFHPPAAQDSWVIEKKTHCKENQYPIVNPSIHPSMQNCTCQAWRRKRYKFWGPTRRWQGWGMLHLSFALQLMSSFRMIRFKLTTQQINLLTTETLRIKHQQSNKKHIGFINSLIEAMKDFFLSRLKINSICKTFAHCQCGVVMFSMVTLQGLDRSMLCWSLLLKQHRPTEAVMNFLWSRLCQFSNNLPDQGQNIVAMTP